MGGYNKNGDSERFSNQKSKKLETLGDIIYGRPLIALILNLGCREEDFRCIPKQDRCSTNFPRNRLPESLS